MSTARPNHVPVLLWPFHLVWRVLSFAIEAIGRMACAVLGAAMLAVGVALSLTLIGAPLGVALGALGMLLLLRAFF